MPLVYSIVCVGADVLALCASNDGFAATGKVLLSLKLNMRRPSQNPIAKARVIAMICWRCSSFSVGQSWRNSESCRSDGGAFGVNFSEESTFPRVFDGCSIPVSPIINKRGFVVFSENTFLFLEPTIDKKSDIIGLTLDLHRWLQQRSVQ